MKRAQEGSLHKAASALGVHLTPEEGERVIAFEALIADRAIPAGYVAASDRERLRERHILDCLRAAPHVPQNSAACDLGSGAGLPGVVVAIARPDVRVALVERRRGKAAFLELAAEQLDLRNVQVIAGAAESLSMVVDACLARAFGSVDRAWDVSRPLLRTGGRLIYFAGAGFDAAAVPGGRSARIVDAGAVLASAGPLVIMTRQ